MLGPREALCSPNGAVHEAATHFLQFKDLEHLKSHLYHMRKLLLNGDQGPGRSVMATQETRDQTVAGHSHYRREIIIYG